MKPLQDRRVYVMRIYASDYGDVTVECFDYPQQDMAGLDPADTTLYTRTRHHGDYDVRALLYDQYVNIATWLHRQGMWEQLPIDL